MRNLIHSSVPLNYLTSPRNNIVRVEHPRNPLAERAIEDLTSGCRCNHDEVCGFITDTHDLIYVPNSHSEPHYNFYMHIEDIQEALDEICKVNEQNVIGVFHTHPTNVPWPSPVDINGWPNLDLGWRYWIATNHEVVEWSKAR